MHRVEKNGYALYRVVHRVTHQMLNPRPTLEGPLGNGIYVSRDLEDAKMKLMGFKPKVKPPPPIVVVPPKEKGKVNIAYYSGAIYHYRDSPRI